MICCNETELSHTDTNGIMIAMVMVDIHSIIPDRINDGVYWVMFSGINLINCYQQQSA